MGWQVKSQLVNIEGMQLEKHHLSTIILIIESSKSHTWTLNLSVYERLRTAGYSHSLKIFFHKIQYKGENTTFKVEKLGRYAFNQVVPVNIINKGTN